MKGAILAGDDVLPPDGAVPPPWPARRVMIDGAMLHVRDTPGTTPEAEPAVYVHGLGGSSQNWTDFAGLLADRLDGQAVDLPGFGESEPSLDVRQSVAELEARLTAIEGALGWGGTTEPFIGSDVRPDLVGGPDYARAGDLQERMAAGDRDAKLAFDTLPPS